MLNWIQDNEILIWWITTLSVVTFFATLILIPVLILRLPADYFVREDKQQWPNLRQELRLTLIVAKNVLGAVLFVAGVSMLFLPGQGLLTIFVGIILMNFPGKRRFEQWLVQHGPILRGLNWIRVKRHREPLERPKTPKRSQSRRPY